jgi:hypothetical protein
MKTNTKIIAETPTTKVLKVWVDPVSVEEKELLKEDNNSFLGQMTKQMRDDYFNTQISFIKDTGEIEVHQDSTNPNGIIVLWTKK